MSKKKKAVLSDSEISAFCQQISLILQAGLPTYYGISILRDETKDEKTHKLLEQIYAPMEDGGTLHAALEATNAFPDYMVHMIQLGEETGRLEEVLQSLSEYYEREAEIRAGIRNAVTYPLVTTALMLVVIVVMITKVLPVFSQIYTELGSELTGFAASLMNFSDALNRYLLVIIAVLAVLILLGFLLYRTDLGKTLFLGRPFSMSIASSRFANSMHLALSSGLDTDRSMDLASELVDNPYMRDRIRKCKEYIAHGEGLSRSMMLSGIFSEIYASWITIGYKTGSMDLIMSKISAAYEEETNGRLQHFVNVLEPTLIIVLCVFMGAILISFLLPLLGIMSAIG